MDPIPAFKALAVWPGERNEPDRMQSRTGYDAKEKYKQARDMSAGGDGGGGGRTTSWSRCREPRSEPVSAGKQPESNLLCPQNHVKGPDSSVEGLWEIGVVHLCVALYDFPSCVSRKQQ